MDARPGYPLPRPLAEAIDIAILLGLCLAVGALRFAHTTPDSPDYAILVEFLRGNAAESDLTAPFSYRVGAGLLAAGLTFLPPFEALAVVSLSATMVGMILLRGAYRQMGLPSDVIALSLALQIVSFPFANYASRALTDGQGWLILCLGFWFLTRGWWVATACLLILAMSMREACLMLLIPFAMALYDRESHRRLFAAALLGATVLGCLAVMIFCRHLFEIDAGYVWTPGLDSLTENLTRPLSLYVVGATVLPPLFLLVAGLWLSPPARSALARFLWTEPAHRWRAAWLFAGCMLLGYSAVAAFFSGRFAWPLYPVLLPAAALAIHRWPQVQALVGPAARLFQPGLSATPSRPQAEGAPKR